MDRREALKKIVAGGAVVGGSVLVVSQPAFAYTAPTVTSQPFLSNITKTGPRTASVRFNLGSASCPASATSTSASASVTLVDASSSLGAPIDITSASPVITVTKNSGPGQGQNWQLGEILAVTGEIVYTCTYAGDSRSTCRSVTGRATSSGNGNSGQFIGETSDAATSC